MTNIDEDILEELRTINRLLVHTLLVDATSQTERILRLERYGFSPSKIANFLNLGDNYVSSILSRARKAEAKKQRTKPSKVSVSQSND